MTPQATYNFEAALSKILVESLGVQDFCMPSNQPHARDEAAQKKMGLFKPDNFQHIPTFSL